jgi:hypothetical protein
MKSEWSDWLPFPDPKARGILQAPFGPGCYELRFFGTMTISGLVRTFVATRTERSSILQ